MTAERFNQIKSGSALHRGEAMEYLRLLKWERKSNAAKRAVETKQAKYTTWPTRRNDHETR